MKELIEYRKNLVEKLVAVAREFCEACRAVKDPFAPLEDGWNVHQIAMHTRDVHLLVYRFRAERTAQGGNPEFQNFDGDTYIKEHYDASETLNNILNNFMASVESYTMVLSRLPTDAWSLTSRHVTFGDGFTLQTWVERDLAHMEEHLNTVKKAI